MQAGQRILVLGIGNLLWADEGFGVRAVEAFNARHVCPDDVRILDGGTQGVYLLPHLQDCDALIVFDAIDYGLMPGTLKLIEDSAVPAFMGAKKLSLHQTGFQEVLASAFMLGWEPRRILLIGVQPEDIEDYGGSLSAVVAGAVEAAVGCAAQELVRLGVSLTTRADAAATLGPDALERRSYEEGRPSEDEACRTGDIRFLAMRAEG
jgi:hydrogenase maturation protease